MIRSKSRRGLGSSNRVHCSRRTSPKPRTAVSGVRSSWDTVARNWSFRWSASRSRAISSRSWARAGGRARPASSRWSVMSRSVHTRPSTSGSSSRFTTAASTHRHPKRAWCSRRGPGSARSARPWPRRSRPSRRRRRRGACVEGAGPRWCRRGRRRSARCPGWSTHGEVGPRITMTSSMFSTSDSRRRRWLSPSASWRTRSVMSRRATTRPVGAVDVTAPATWTSAWRHSPSAIRIRVGKEAHRAASSTPCSKASSTGSWSSGGRTRTMWAPLASEPKSPVIPPAAGFENCSAPGGRSP